MFKIIKLYITSYARLFGVLSSMAPLKKSRRGKKKKLKASNSNIDGNSNSNSNSNANANPCSVDDPKNAEMDWWECFWRKNSASGPNAPCDEDEGFKYFFRVSKNTFEYICSLVRQDLVSRPPSGLINIEGRLLSVEKQVAIAMRRLASGESQVSVGGAFGVGQSTVSQVTWRFIESMEERARHHLKWPNQESIDEIKAKVETSFGLPNCCGAIDATHIIMTLPAVESSDDWCDQESNYSMLLQGIVDHELRFLDIVTGWPGSMTVSRLLKCSGFFKLCEDNKRLSGGTTRVSSSENIEIREFIVGDTSYPLLPWLMTPYEATNNATAAMVSFNKNINAIRLLAVKAFAQLKGVWRILHKVMWRPDKHKLPSIILVCCLLHNILIDCHDEVHSDILIKNHHDAGYKEQNCHQADPSGKILRENLMMFLEQNRQLHPSRLDEGR